MFGMSLSPCHRYHPAGVTDRIKQISVTHAALALPLQARPPGIRTFGATCAFTFVTACCFANWELTTSCYQNAAPVSYRGVRIIPRAGLKPAR